MPKHGISAQAFKANELNVVAGQLLYKSRRVKALALTEYLKGFLRFLKSLRSKVILVAYNGKVFDSRLNSDPCIIGSQFVE